MPKGFYKLPNIENEPVRSYAPGSEDRAALKAKLKELNRGGTRPSHDDRG
jgi:1-pyrroline-5-carboxylate dehydrogenase